MFNDQYFVPLQAALVDKLRRRRDHLNESGKVKESNGGPAAEPTTVSPLEAAAQMRLDWTQGKRSPAIFKENMVLARPVIIQAAKKSPGLQLLRDFPALNLPEIVSTIPKAPQA